MSTQTQTPTRGPGRPANFPGVECTKRLYNLPKETLALIAAEAAKRDEPVGVALNRLVEAGFKQCNRKRKG